MSTITALRRLNLKLPRGQVKGLGLSHPRKALTTTLDTRIAYIDWSPVQTCFQSLLTEPEKYTCSLGKCIPYTAFCMQSTYVLITRKDFQGNKIPNSPTRLHQILHTKIW